MAIRFRCSSRREPSTCFLIIKSNVFQVKKDWMKFSIFQVTNAHWRSAAAAKSFNHYQISLQLNFDLLRSLSANLSYAKIVKKFHSKNSNVQMIRVAQGFASSEEHVKLDLETKAPTRRREYFKRLFLHQKPYESERLSTSGFQHTERVGVSSSETSFRF